MTAAVDTGYGVGFAVGQPLLLTLAGVGAGVAILALVLIRLPWHEIGRRPGGSETVQNGQIGGLSAVEA